ncbi:MAG: cytochrome c biogenesis protein CcsA [Akkermansiaceae bacterium]|nr:cytochrome c biogenesis protein CcsA [Armatimonadota bacterium]
MKTVLANSILFLWLGAGLGYIFLVLPPAYGFQVPELARIVALHLPNAFVAVLAAFLAGWFGVRYLTKGRQPIDDVKSSVAAGLAALFCFLTTITGSVFAQVQWGSYWNWDPKQISIFLLLLIYGAYFVLRAGIEDPDKRGTVSAVYVLFATVMTPLLGYVVPKYMQGLHPKDADFDPSYRMAIYMGILPGLVWLMARMYRVAVRVEAVRLRREALETL